MAVKKERKRKYQCKLPRCPLDVSSPGADTASGKLCIYHVARWVAQASLNGKGEPISLDKWIERQAKDEGLV